MKKILFWMLFILLVVQSSSALASDFLNIYKNENSRAEQHGKKGMELEMEMGRVQGEANKNYADKAKYNELMAKAKDLDDQVAVEWTAAIRAYLAEPQAQVDEDKFAGTLQALSRHCEGTNPKNSCDDTVVQGMQTIEKYWPNFKSKYAGQAQKAVGDDFNYKKDYTRALWSYRLAYDKLSNPPCSESHIGLLTNILNTLKSNNDKKSYDQYWSIVQWCESSGKMEPKGMRVFVDAKTDKVFWQSSPPPMPNGKPASPQTAMTPPEVKKMEVKSKSEFVTQVAIVSNEANALTEKMIAGVVEKATNNTDPGVKKMFEDARAQREKQKQASWDDYQKLLQTNEKVKKKQLGNVSHLSAGTTKQKVRDIFGDSDDEDRDTLAYQLYTGGPMVFQTKGVPGFTAPRVLIVFKFDTRGALDQILFTTIGASYSCTSGCLN